MAINRFSQGPIAADVQSSFIPLPIDLIDRQIQRKQSQYDTTKAFIGETKDTLYGIQGLSPDRDVLKSTIGQYESDIEKEVEKVGGDYSRLTGVADQFGSKLKKDIMQGHLGAIHNNFTKAQAHMQELDERRKKGDISEAGYNLGLESISAFGGTIQTENGDYTKAAFYNPTKFVELGKLSDEYGKVIADQYTQDGRKYISGAKAQELISHNLWNNPEAVANAREQVRVALPREQWGTEEENAALSSFMNKIAKDSGYKLQYMQQFKDEGTDNLTGGNVLSYDLIGTRPANSLISTEGTEFRELMKQGKKTSRTGSVLSFIQEALSTFVVDVPVPTVGEDGEIVKGQRAFQRAQETRERHSKKATEIVSKLGEQDLIKDLAEMNGIDLSNPNYETLVQLESAIEQLNKSSANTRLTLQNNEKTFDAFKRITNSGAIQNMRVEDARTGERIPVEDIQTMLLTHAEAKGAGAGALVYAGEVNTPGQAYPFGSLVATYNDPSGEARQVIIDPAQNKGTMDYLQDRVIAAKNLGSSNFRQGNDHFQFLRTPDGSIAAYKNGKAMINPENQQRIYYK